MENFYEAALKAGQKYYTLHLLSGTDPYLPVLNDILPEQMIACASDAGWMNVPAEKIVGTLTAGRSRSFAGNFMPIARKGSEFSLKWKSLAESQQAEGIREPVLLYEYMNRYYVQEGNKRVSVLKFFDAVSVPASVRRILPERTDDPKVTAYYEYLEFSRETGILFLNFTEPGGYEELYSLLGKAAGEKWTEQEISRLKTLYYRFRLVFLAEGGGKLQIEVGDALLACLRVLGFSYFHSLSPDEMKKEMRKVWEEILLQKEEEKIELKLDPEELSNNVISKILAPKRLKAAFFYNKEGRESSWVMGHELARAQVQEQFAGKVETSVYVCSGEQALEQQLNKAIEEGADVIFATSAEMLPACLKAAVHAPHVEFMNCCLNKPHRYVRAYYPRMYEGKFVAGAIAGALSETDRIGFICKYPVYGSVADINAFARGVKMTNPKAKVLLKWSALKTGGSLPEELEQEGVQLVSMLDYQNKKEGILHLHGLEKIENGVLTPLVLPVWNWSVYYEWILSSMLNGTYKSDKEKTSRSLQYYWGLSSGAVKLLFAERLPVHVRYLGELLVRTISDGTCRPFFEPARRGDGSPDWEDLDRSLDLERILEMTELEDNVIGRLPAYDELTEQAQKLIDLIGIQSVKESKEALKTGDSAVKGTPSGKEAE